MGTVLHPIGKRRLATQVAESLRRYMAERELQPGDRLPSERDLAAVFAVSRHVVREALRTLQEDGLVAVEQGKDTLVRRRLPLSDLGELPEAGTNPDRHVRDARAVFESGLAECIVERASEADSGAAGGNRRRDATPGRARAPGQRG